MRKEKFLGLRCRKGSLNPSCYEGGVDVKKKEEGILPH